MSYKTDENYYFSTIYKINWNWLKHLNLNGPCFTLPHWFSFFHCTEVSGISVSRIQPFISRNCAFRQTPGSAPQMQPPPIDTDYNESPEFQRANPLKYNGNAWAISLAFTMSSMHSFSLFWPHCISGFRVSYQALPSSLQNQAKCICHFIHIKDTGCPLWIATS